MLESYTNQCFSILRVSQVRHFIRQVSCLRKTVAICN